MNIGKTPKHKTRLPLTAEKMKAIKEAIEHDHDGNQAEFARAVSIPASMLNRIHSQNPPAPNATIQQQIWLKILPHIKQYYTTPPAELSLIRFESRDEFDKIFPRQSRQFYDHPQNQSQAQQGTPANDHTPRFAPTPVGYISDEVIAAIRQKTVKKYHPSIITTTQHQYIITAYHQLTPDRQQKLLTAADKLLTDQLISASLDRLSQDLSPQDPTINPISPR